MYLSLRTKPVICLSFAPDTLVEYESTRCDERLFVRFAVSATSNSHRSGPATHSDDPNQVDTIDLTSERWCLFLVLTYAMPVCFHIVLCLYYVFPVPVNPVAKRSKGVLSRTHPWSLFCFCETLFMQDALLGDVSLHGHISGHSAKKGKTDRLGAPRSITRTSFITVPTIMIRLIIIPKMTLPVITSFIVTSPIITFLINTSCTQINMSPGKR